MFDHHPILVIAAPTDILSHFARPLRNAGFDVFEAASALDGLRIAKEYAPVIIFLQLSLPEMSGVELCHQLKTQCYPASPYILLITEQNDSNDEDQPDEHDVDGYIIQTAPSRELVARTRSIFRLKQTETGLLQALEALQEKHAALLDMQEQLQRHETMLNGIFECSPNAIVVSDMRGVIIACNSSALELYGASSKDDVIGKDGRQFIAQDDRQEPRSDPQELLEPGRVKHIEYRLARKNGDLFFGEVSASVMTDEAGAPLGIISIIRDATERKNAEIALQISKARYEFLVNTMNEGLASIDEQRRFTFVNSKFCEMTGYHEQELLGIDSRLVIAPEEESHHRQELAERRMGKSGKYETRLIKKQGDSLSVILSGSPLYNAQGVYDGALGVFTDITAIKQAERALKDSEERYHALFENSPISLWELDLSKLKAFLDAISTQETPDIEQYASDHPELVRKGIEFIHVCDINQATLKTFEIQNKEELFTQFWMLWTEEALAALTQQVFALWRGAKEFTIETTNKTYSGKILHVRIKMALAPGYEKNWARALVTVVDLTERKQIEDALTRERYLLRTLMEYSPDLIYFKDRESRFLRVNNAFARRAALDPQSILGKTDFDIVGPEHAKKAFADEQRIMKTGEPLIDQEERETWLNGRITWASTTKLPFYDEHGNIIGTFGISREITSRKLAERYEHLTTQILDLLNRSDRKIDVIREILLLVKDFTGLEAVGIRLRSGEDFPYYKTIGFPPKFEEVERYLCARDEHGNIICDSNGNSILECMCGNVLCGRTNPSLPFFTTAGSFWSNNTTELLASTSETDLQAYMRNHCNREGYESMALIPLRSGPRTIGLLQLNDHRKDMLSLESIRFFEGLGASIGIAIEHRETEEEMARLRNFMKNIIDSMPSILLGIDIEGRVTHWNLEAEKVTRHAAHDVQGRFLHDVFPEFAPFLEKVRDAILQQCPFKEEKVRSIIHGEMRDFNIMVYPLVSSGVDGAVIRIDDVTEQVRMEEMIVQSEKMVSLGNLAAGMAHELNNPIASILQNTQVILTRLTRHFPANTIAALESGTNMDAIREFMLKRDIIKILELIRSSGERAGEIVKDMLSFSRKRSSHAVPNDLHDLIEKAVEFASHAYNIKFAFPLKNFRIIRQFDSRLPKIRCEGAQIQQVILNLLINAAQAAAEHYHRQEEPTIILRTQRDGDMVRIEVEDNGPGMPEHVRKRVFEPFFTTKEVGLGTGLGLSVSYFIITEHHNGTMSVESEPDKGCRFIIMLPIGAEDPAMLHSWQI
ncbi:signal transduction histidine kinase, nitrogen specific, NtrB [Candidatus Moduliflexus flocculans]|uniref:histidine kinase n=1 Tax=Candidatus Moduliflexus flocculans TaxID=1499966 RepID=A0A0S6VWZ8_9BACT|nr:signal transduction histidine kinase, nitrogen specific, NtrB [Candidatus Moduliflexus flocculans]